MHPEIEELRPKLKEILYDCAVEMRATKAALFLFNGAGRFELVTEYGFKAAIRQSVDYRDPLVDRSGRGRTPFFVNGVASEPRFSEILYEAMTDRIFVAPVWLRGTLVGFVDMRDKGAKALFEQNDIAKGQRIADRIAALFSSKNVFGQHFIALSEAEDEPHATRHEVPAAARPAPPRPVAPPPVVAAPATPAVAPRALAQPAPVAARPAAPIAVAPIGASFPAPVTAPAAAPQLRAPEPPPSASGSIPRVSAIITDARSASLHIVIPPTPESLTENEIAAARDVLRALLLIPSVSVAMFSAFGHLGGVQEIAGRAALADDAVGFLQSKLAVWLSKRGESATFVRTNIETPQGAGSSPITMAQLPKVFTAPVIVGPQRGLYLTVAFSSAPERSVHELLAAFLGHLQLAIEQSLNRGKLETERWKMAEELLQPRFLRYPDLYRHSKAVAARAETFARYLGLDAAEVGQIRLVALVHDVGMRLLEYDRLYKKHDASAEEISILREHVSVGAGMVEPLLGHEVARAVLCHHERVDGRGYPNELHGDEIPLASRILQICDVFEMMTDPDSYQPQQSVPSALAIIARGVGGQFDAELAARFQEMIRTS